MNIIGMSGLQNSVAFKKRELPNLSPRDYLGGFSYPFLHQALTQGRQTRFIAAEPAACPTMTKGRYTFDYSDTGALAPIMKMYTLGHRFVPPGIHAAGLRYHGMAPSVSALVANGYIEARAVLQVPVFNAAVQFARAEGILPAPESGHAIRVAIDEALKCKETGEAKVIAFAYPVTVTLI